LWFIALECHELLDAIPVLVADPEKDGDIIKTDSVADDIADTARYGLKSMVAPVGMPKEEKVKQAIEDVRKGFVTKAVEATPGVDPFAKFGGKKL
jgi:hypothetical protein